MADPNRPPEGGPKLVRPPLPPPPRGGALPAAKLPTRPAGSLPPPPKPSLPTSPSSQSRPTAKPPARTVKLADEVASHLPESTSGVVTGASTSPSTPPPPSAADLPVLAPPARAGESSLPPPTVAQKKVVQSSDIDIELEVLETAMAAAVFAADAEEKSARAKEAPSAPAALKLPAICTYGRYEVLGRIAFGGMAEIFLGRESTSVGASRYLVIKRILPHVANDEQFVQMFLDEARLAIQLNHPNICHIYEFGELESSYFIAMEWINGVPLGKLIRKARIVGGIPPEIAVRIIAQTAEALHYAHRAKDALGRPLGIVHRDVSPHNVMVAYDGQVKLLDFGIAKASSHHSKTEAGVVKGKFSYMAPEQCVGKTVDARADVFALGICLFETLTGQALYHKENEYETMHAVIHDEAPSIRDLRKDLPERLDAIVQKALRKKAEERYQTAGEMQLDLEGWLAETKRVVNAGSVAELMEELYEEQIQRGPLVDSTPFGQSFQRLKPAAGVDVSQSQPSARSAQASSQVSSAAAPALEAAPVTRGASWLPVAVAAGVVVVGLGVGWALFAGKDDPAPVIAEAAQPTRVVEPRPEPPRPEPAPEPMREPPPAAVEQGPRVGTLLVESTPSGATVQVDAQEAPRATPTSVADLSVGTHHVVVRRAGYRDWEGDVDVTDGDVVRVEATLVPAPREPTAPPGRISINTVPWSKVYVGSRLLGTTPIAEATVPSGTVRLRLVDRDGQTHNRTVRVGASETERLFFNLAE